MASREEVTEQTIRLIVDLYNGLANAAEILRRVPRDIRDPEWNVEEIAETANGVIERLMQVENPDEVNQDRLLSYVVRLSNPLIRANGMLSQYSRHLEAMPGRGAIRGFLVRSGLNQTESLLQRVDQLSDDASPRLGVR